MEIEIIHIIPKCRHNSGWWNRQGSFKFDSITSTSFGHCSTASWCARCLSCYFFQKLNRFHESCFAGKVGLISISFLFTIDPMAKMGRGETSSKTHGLMDHPKKSDCYGARNKAFGKTPGKYFEWTVFCIFDHLCGVLRGIGSGLAWTGELYFELPQTCLQRHFNLGIFSTLLSKQHLQNPDVIPLVNVVQFAFWTFCNAIIFAPVPGIQVFVIRFCFFAMTRSWPTLGVAGLGAFTLSHSFVQPLLPEVPRLPRAATGATGTAAGSTTAALGAVGAVAVALPLGLRRRVARKAEPNQPPSPGREPEIDPRRQDPPGTIPPVRMPMVDTGSGEKIDVMSKLLQDRIIILGGEVKDEMAQVLVAQMLYLANTDPTQDITMYINSPGGSVSAGMVTLLHFGACVFAYLCSSFFPLFLFFFLGPIYTSILDLQCALAGLFDLELCMFCHAWWRHEANRQTKQPSNCFTKGLVRGLLLQMGISGDDSNGLCNGSCPYSYTHNISSNASWDRFGYVDQHSALFGHFLWRSLCPLRCCRNLLWPIIGTNEGLSLIESMFSVQGLSLGSHCMISRFTIHCIYCNTRKTRFWVTCITSF